MLDLNSTLHTSNKQDVVCSRCASIDFRTAFKTRSTQPGGRCISKLDHLTMVPSSATCPICCFLVDMRPKLTHSTKPACASFCLHAFSNIRTFALNRDSSVTDIPNIEDTTCLAVIRSDDCQSKGSWKEIQKTARETGYICSLDPMASSSRGIQARHINPHRIDFDIVRSWLNFCSKYHRKACSPVIEGDAISLRVIDCKGERLFPIIPAPKACKYVALSYVWGPPDSHEPLRSLHDSHINAESIPKVIKDAISVTKELNFEYLWVDRYCIPQDAQEKHEQIRRMDRVYAGAYLTIIAAAGDGPSFGLPGVLGTPRIPQKLTQTGSLCLVTTLKDSHHLIKDSVWATRGWTYQEGLLSKKRLVFTDHQVYFECCGMHCCEAISKPLEILHTKNKNKFRHSISPGYFPFRVTGLHPKDVIPCIEEYSTRRLTYDSDTLNAMLGTLETFRKSCVPWPFSHHWGVPILPVPPGRPSVEGLFFGFSWYHLQPARRRVQFPSYSWAGWEGEMKYLSYARYMDYFRAEKPYLHVQIESQNGTFMGWDEYQRRPAIGLLGLAHGILIRAKVLRFRVRRAQPSEQYSTEYIAELPFAKPRSKESVPLYAPIHLSKDPKSNPDFAHKLETETWEGILLGPIKGHWNGGFSLPAILVVERCEETAERVGLFGELKDTYLYSWYPGDEISTKEISLI
ncbi:hypothetical protein FOXG_19327 [Fusarium oxysporum f. sp. lycopersici 4287]|nr:hypothetical protein FOXG_19327 [Fusarium oxysporum f. sp. lycopersici 4287]KNB04560.1 hypothetical protein FOXG_19327 [Fusarium oxysporum f. sp. lycopersici 4287]